MTSPLRQLLLDAMLIQVSTMGWMTGWNGPVKPSGTLMTKALFPPFLSLLSPGYP
jgi:hypothetical protein